jgi:Tol biopolymer transport system component
LFASIPSGGADAFGGPVPQERLTASSRDTSHAAARMPSSNKAHFVPISLPTPSTAPSPDTGRITLIAPVYWSWGPVVSADGKFVVFESAEANRHPGDPDWNMDVFVHDRLTGETSIISRGPDGTAGGEYAYADSISADGRYITFSSRAHNLVQDDTNREWDVFLYDQLTGETTRVSVASDGRQGNGGSLGSAISANGQVVVFNSWATNIVGPDQNRRTDVFLRDLETGHTSLASRALDGTPGNDDSDEVTISSDGNHVGFTSTSTNLVGGDTNGARDVFVQDWLASEMARVSVATDGAQANGDSSGPSLSADGRYVVFVSAATNLVTADTNGEPDVFIHDRLTGATARVSVASDGKQADRGSGWGSLSGDGQFVAFYSDATNLVAADTNALGDAFVHDRLAGETSRVSLARDGSQGSLGASAPSISADGRYIVFNSADLGGVVVFDPRPVEAPSWLPTSTATPEASLSPTTVPLEPSSPSPLATPIVAVPTEISESASIAGDSFLERLGVRGCGAAWTLLLLFLGLAAFWKRS